MVERAVGRMTAHGKYLRPSCLPDGCNLDRKNPHARKKTLPICRLKY